MFDINDIAKTAFEPVLFTPLQRAQKDGYINITGVDGKKKNKPILFTAQP